MWIKLTTLALLYFVQGAPYGFQSACLPLILRSFGMSFTSLGLMKLLFLPWVLKPFYAPLVDKYFTRKWWLQSSMLALALTCLVTSVAVDESQITKLSILLFLLNLFSSVQDIAVDSLAVSLLNENELGAGNTVQVVAYKAGSMFAGSLLLFVREVYGWTIMFMAFSSIYFLTILLCNVIEIQEKKIKDKKEEETKIESLTTEVLRIFQVPGTIWMVFFVLTYKLCERAEQTFALYLVDQGIAREELAILSTFIRAFSILGSTVSGLILTKYRASNIVQCFAVSRTLTILAMTFVIFQNQIQTFKYFGYLSICLTSISAGGITTAAFTMMMTLSQKADQAFQGTHYSILATCEVLGKLLFAAFAGWLTDLVGLQAIYAFFSLLAVMVVKFIRTFSEVNANKLKIS